jgi:hypothetical protein
MPGRRGGPLPDLVRNSRGISFVATRGQNSRRAAGYSIAGAIYRFNDHQHGSSTPIRQDKQMPNTGLAPLYTVTEPAIAGEGDLDQGDWFQPSRPSVGAATIE